MGPLKKREKNEYVTDFERVKLSDKLYKKFSEKMYQLAGVDLPLNPKNQALIRNRLIKLLRRHSFATYEAYWDYLESGEANRINEFISALTTNMTSFYRESSHFEFLAKTLPKLPAKFGNEIRIWCAAASTGQEPYTIGMTILDTMAEMNLARCRLLATDIDLQVLKKSAMGIYEEREMEGLPGYQKQKFFDKVMIEQQERWRVKTQLSNLIRFAPFNLMNQHYEFKQKFHIVFCRNVLIYFDNPTKKRVIDNLVESLAVGGYLILGHSESGNVKNPQLAPLSKAVYQKI